MKKLTQSSGRILGLAAISAFAAVCQAQNVTVNGRTVQFEGPKPHIMNGQLMVPIRKIVEEAGGTVDWNAYDRTVTAKKDATTVELQLRDDVAKVNGIETGVNGDIHIMDGWTFVPIRFLAESLNASIEWDNTNLQANFSTNPNVAMQTFPSNSDVVATPEVRVSPSPELPPVMFSQPTGTVIQARLDDELSSETSFLGETFTATIDTNGNGDYFGLPEGTKIKGHVAFIQPMHDGMPGVLGLSYDGLILNDERRMGIWASPIAIDTDITKSDDGRLIVTSSGDTKDNMKFIGSGSSSGVLVPLITTGTTVSVDVIDQSLPTRGESYDVVLGAGTMLGVRLDHETIIRAPN